MSRKRASYPTKRTMNLFYKPDRTTKPATIALYILFGLVCILGLSKFLVYDLWMEAQQAQQTLDAAQAQLAGVTAELTDFQEVQEKYSRYSSAAPCSRRRPERTGRRKSPAPAHAASPEAAPCRAAPPTRGQIDP